MPISPELEQVWSEFERGKRTALARAITLVENRTDGFLELLNRAHPRLGVAHRIGITGPPGAGKSTLSSALVQHYRAQGERVGVIAVDPTSPFTGGAMLGDRVRMNDVALDDGVFIRSMATRGSLGGLALTTKEVADVMDAFGFQRVLIESVGVGQSELDIATAADTTTVVLVPESGDSIQAMKAGLMEIADLFVINKADRPGADRLAREVEMMLHLRMGQAMRNVPAHHGVDLGRVRRRGVGAARRQGVRASGPESEAGDAAERWAIPVLQTVAERAQGVVEFAVALDRHRAWLQQSGELIKRQRSRLLERVKEAVQRRLHDVVWREKGGDKMLQDGIDEVQNGQITPYELADRIVQAMAG